MVSKLEIGSTFKIMFRPYSPGSTFKPVVALSAKKNSDDQKVGERIREGFKIANLNI